jgi:hypothetical protein
VGLAFVIGNGVGNTARGTSASGTSIPISKGGTGATTAQGALQSLLPDFADNNGRVLGSNGTSIGWVDGGKDSYMTPDYARQEAVTLTEPVGSPRARRWQADRTGFVTVIVDAAATSFSGYISLAATINGKTVGGSISPATTSTLEYKDTFPINAGDVVEISLGANQGVAEASMAFACYFIPPKYSTPPDNIIIEEGAGGSYSTSEVKTNETWIDEKPIYKTTIQIDATTMTKGTSKRINMMPYDVDTIVGGIEYTQIYSDGGSSTGGSVAYNERGTQLYRVFNFFRNLPPISGNEECYLTALYTAEAPDRLLTGTIYLTVKYTKKT